MELKLSTKTLSSLNERSRDAKRFISNEVNQESDLINTNEYYQPPTGCHTGTCSGSCTGSCKGGCKTSCKGVFMY